jgi:hypothetical protein
MTSPQYTTLQTLTSMGRSKPVPIPAAARYLLTHSEESLLTSSEPIARLCLRCFISHTIVTTIRSLVHQFGTKHHFRDDDLLPIVLDDDGSLEPTPYNPVSLQILSTYDPKIGTLTNWTIRHVRQHPEVKRFLLEQGVYLISTWALLNDTKPDRLYTILTHLSNHDITQSHHLLTAYRAIYLPDRLKANTRKTCPPPTLEQLTRISIELENRSQIRLLPEQILNKLETLSKQIRQYRMNQKTGLQSDRSLDDPNFQLPLESETPIESQDTTQTDFLTQYRTRFTTALTTAIAAVITDRTAATPKKAPQFLTALKAYYCEQIAMGDIAALIGVRGQDVVSRLMQLKDLRSDIRRHMLSNLKTAVFSLITIADLAKSDRAIEAALDEQLETLMQEESQRDKTPKGLKKGDTRLSVALCDHLDNIQGSPENSS